MCNFCNLLIKRSSLPLNMKKKKKKQTQQNNTESSNISYQMIYLDGILRVIAQNRVDCHSGDHDFFFFTLASLRPHPNLI